MFPLSYGQEHDRSDAVIHSLPRLPPAYPHPYSPPPYPPTPYPHYGYTPTQYAPPIGYNQAPAELNFQQVDDNLYHKVKNQVNHWIC